MADLAALMKIAPNSGAMMMGQQFGQEQATAETERQRLQQMIADLQQAHQQNDLMNPLRVENQSLANQGLQAGLPGIAADSSLKGTNAAKAAGTLQTDIAAGNSKNDLQLDDDKKKKFKNASDILMQAAPMLEQIPEGIERTLATQKVLDQTGIKSDSPQGQMLLKNPALMSKVAKRMGELAADASPAYKQAIDVANIQADKSLEVGKGNNETAIKVAQIQAAAKVAAKGSGKTMEALIAASKNPIEKAEKLESAAAAVADDNQALADQYLIRAKEARIRAAEDALNKGLATPRVDAAGTTGGKVVNTPPPSATAPIGGSSPSLTPAAGGAQSTDAAIAAAVKKAGGVYDPQKYEYRMGPNGVQRKAK